MRIRFFCNVDRRKRTRIGSPRHRMSTLNGNVLIIGARSARQKASSDWCTVPSRRCTLAADREYARFSCASDRAGRLASVSLFPYSSFANCECNEIPLVTPMPRYGVQDNMRYCEGTRRRDEGFTNSESKIYPSNFHLRNTKLQTNDFTAPTESPYCSIILALNI